MNARCITIIENYPDAVINCIYVIDEYSQAFEEMSVVLEIQLKIMFYSYTQKEFTTSNDYPENRPGNSLYDFHIRHHQAFSSLQI